MRAAAGVIVLVVLGGWGLYRSRLLKRRCVLISELRLLLMQYSIEIKYTAPTLYQLAERGRGEFADILRECLVGEDNIRRAWESAAEKLSRLPYCRKEEAEIMAAVGRELGTVPAESALSLLQLYSARLDRLFEQAEQTFARKGKLYSSGGILAGLAAAVLVI